MPVLDSVLLLAVLGLAALALWAMRRRKKAGRNCGDCRGCDACAEGASCGVHEK